jgi:Kdo2-lipid IVA lauroyltransferase/acyltransferase
MFFLRLISRLPFFFLYRISDFLFVVSYYLVRYRINVVRGNLNRSFPDKSNTELRHIEKEFYKNLADYAVEFIKLLTITPDALTSRLQFKNVELVERLKGEGKSMIGLASHQFNWEWILTAGSLAMPIPLDFVYQPVGSAFFEKFSLACRTRFGAFAIKRNDVARETFRRRNIQRLISIVGDQYPGYGHDKKYFTRFLRQETVFFDGTNQLAELTQLPVLYFKVRKQGRGKYEVTIQEVVYPPFLKNDKRPVESYARALEKMIDAQPSNWLWSHNRWKKRHLEGEDKEG